MFDTAISLIAPHRCYLCGISGALLCKSCIYNIVNDSQNRCFGCGVPSIFGICLVCAPQLPFSHFSMIGERKDELERILNDFKFNRAYQAHVCLGQLLNASLPVLPHNTIVVPIPTITRHVRIRGYDHTDLIAKSFSALRNLKKQRLLRRKTNTVQLGATARVRQQQANQAYVCPSQLDPDVPYLLLDDIATTGSTLIAAANCLKKAGARTVIAAVIARQVLQPRG